MFNIKQLLLHAYPDATVEIATEVDGIHEKVILKNIYKEDIGFVNKVMEGAGYFIKPTPAEIASFGSLEYSNHLSYEEDEFVQGELAEDSSEEDTEEDESDEVETQPAQKKSKSGDKLRKNLKDQAPEIDSDGRSFKVLTTPEMHKFAMKVYTSMLGNTENMSNYGIFAYDLDNFLTMHKNTDPSFDGDEDDEDGMSVPSAEKANFIKMNPYTDNQYSLSVLEAADTLFGSDVEHFYSTFGKYMPVEVANTRLISKIIIGIIVKTLSGAVGRAVLAAWEKRDKRGLERALYTLVKIIINDWFPTDEFSFATETKKYGKYKFEDDHLYEIDLDDYTIEDSEKSSDFSNAEIAISPASVGILRLLVALIIKMMAAALGRMMIDAWIKRDKGKFKKLLTYMVLQLVKYSPIEKASTDDSLELEVEKDMELAARKNKTGRSALLSALMGSLSGDRGDKAAQAWDNGDIEAMGDIMGQVTEAILNSMPEADDSGDDEETVSEDTDKSEDTAPSESIDDVTSESSES